MIEADPDGFFILLDLGHRPEAIPGPCAGPIWLHVGGVHSIVADYRASAASTWNTTWPIRRPVAAWACR